MEAAGEHNVGYATWAERELLFLEYGGRLTIAFMKTGSEVSRPECDIFRFG